MLVVYVNKKHKNHIREVAAESVGTGLMNKMVSLNCSQQEAVLYQEVLLASGHSDY